MFLIVFWTVLIVLGIYGMVSIENFLLSWWCRVFFGLVAIASLMTQSGMLLVWVMGFGFCVAFLSKLRRDISELQQQAGVLQKARNTVDHMCKEKLALESQSLSTDQEKLIRQNKLNVLNVELDQLGAHEQISKVQFFGARRGLIMMTVVAVTVGVFCALNISASFFGASAIDLLVALGAVVFGNAYLVRCMMRIE